MKRRKSGPTNPILRSVLEVLKRAKARVWKAVGEKLGKPRRKRIVVNVGEIEKYAEEGEKVVVPGKVLGYGNISKRVTVIAFSFSETAKRKIEEAGGEAITIMEGIERFPEGKGIRIMG